MGIFGGRDKADDAKAALAATAERLGALSLDELADELLRTTFGPGTPGDGHELPLPDVLKPFDPTGSGHFAGLPHELWRDVVWIVEEGLQHLEHRSLIVVGVTGGSQTYTSYRATRAGRAALSG